MLQKNHLLLRFLKLKVVVNGHYIYALAKNKPIVIDMPTNPARLVVTDGFHITKPLELAYSPRHTHFYRIACAIEDDQLLVGFLIIILVYAMGATSGMILLQLLSMVPIFYFLFIYYINRKEFIRIHPVTVVPA
ncbi:MAG TPA: hypothetical protein VFR58_03555 [Flavisolibacter sp.]|nr:hypothetical protein [Flavisolibacter sp.]